MFGKSVVDSAGMIAIKTTANTMKNTNGAVPAERLGPGLAHEREAAGHRGCRRGEVDLEHVPGGRQALVPHPAGGLHEDLRLARAGVDEGGSAGEVASHPV